MEYNSPPHTAENPGRPVGNTNPIPPKTLPKWTNETLPDPNETFPAPADATPDEDDSNPFLPPSFDPTSPEVEDTNTAVDPNDAQTARDKNTREKVNIHREKIILTPRMDDLLQREVELFGKVNFSDEGLIDMKNFQAPTIFTGTYLSTRVADRFLRRPPDHLEWWKLSRANELELPERIYRYGSKWNLFEKDKRDQKILVAWHEEKPEIYIRVDSDRGPIGPEILSELNKEYRQAEKKLLPLRSLISKIPIIKFASTYKINTKLNRIDFLINQHFRISTLDANKAFSTNLEGLEEVIDDLPNKLSIVGVELGEEKEINDRQVSLIYSTTPKLDGYDITGVYRRESDQEYLRRLALLTLEIREESLAIDDARASLSSQISRLNALLSDGIATLARLNKLTEELKQQEEITFSVPESLLIQTPSGDKIQQELNFEIIIRD